MEGRYRWWSGGWLRYVDWRGRTLYSGSAGRGSLGIFNDPTRLVPVTELLHFSPSSEASPAIYQDAVEPRQGETGMFPDCSPSPAWRAGVRSSPAAADMFTPRTSVSRPDPILATVIPPSVRLSGTAQNTAAAPVSPVLVPPPTLNTTFHI